MTPLVLVVFKDSRRAIGGYVMFLKTVPPWHMETPLSGLLESNLNKQ